MTDINNNIKVDELYNGKTWIHGNSNDNINITIFLITICSEQLEYSLDAINNLNTNHNVLINVIMNVSPTNKAYNEMRIRCNTTYFIQNDEDMEIYNNAIDIFYGSVKNNKFFLNTYTLIDTTLGVGNPPIINCLKLYNNDIMKNYPTFSDGKEAISSVDHLWYTNVINDGFKINSTNIIIGFHGKHRTNFDLMLRHCKILKSIMDPRIKTNNGHLCKILRALYSENDELLNYIAICIQHFNLFENLNLDYINKIINQINSYLPQSYLDMYNINNKFNIPLINHKNFNYKYFILLFNNSFNINLDKFFAVFSIFCIATNNYEYSLDKYPYNLYNYFFNIISKKNKEIIFLNEKDVSLVDNNKYNFIIPNNVSEHSFINVKYDNVKNIYYLH